MFPSTKTTPSRRPAPRLVAGLRLIRSFLLLEDDHDVDWEVDQDEHPHRRMARLPLRERRPGAIAPREHVCSCPVSRARGAETPANQPTTTAGRPVGAARVSK